jgi:hypothetical protein
MFKEMGDLERMKTGRADPPMAYNKISSRGIVPINPDTTEAEMVAAMQQLHDWRLDKAKGETVWVAKRSGWLALPMH